LITDYLKYLFQSKNLHGVHSPFVYRLNEIINERCSKTVLRNIDSFRNFLDKNNLKIRIEDFGAGSRLSRKKIRSISEISGTSAINRRFGEILYQLVAHIKPEMILEMGTSLGIGTSYLYSASAKYGNAKIHSIEGSESVSNFTQENFNKFFKNNNVHFHTGEFDAILPGLLNTNPSFDLVYVDGNHRYTPTLNYFQKLAPRMSNHGILIIDDIYWNREMRNVWYEIKSNRDVNCTIDLFRWGMVFFDKSMEKENYVLRFNGFLKAHIS